MSRNRWHILKEGDSYTLSRLPTPRFDVQAEVAFPRANAGRLAQQIRQDLWRELKHLRGFSPVVQIVATDGEMIVRAGGRIDARTKPPAGTEAAIAALLNDPERRTRWAKWARPQGAG